MLRRLLFSWGVAFACGVWPSVGQMSLTINNDSLSPLQNCYAVDLTWQTEYGTPGWGMDGGVYELSGTTIAPGSALTFSVDNSTGYGGFWASYPLAQDVFAIEEATFSFDASTNRSFTIHYAPGADGNAPQLAVTDDDAPRAGMLAQSNWVSEAMNAFLADPTANPVTSNVWAFTYPLGSNLFGQLSEDMITISNSYAVPDTDLLDSSLWRMWEPYDLPVSAVVGGNSFAATWGNWSGALGRKIASWTGGVDFRPVVRGLLCWPVIMLCVWRLSSLLFDAVYESMVVPPFNAQNVTVAGNTVPFSGFLLRLACGVAMGVLVGLLPAILYTFMGSSVSPFALYGLIVHGPLTQAAGAGPGVAGIMANINTWLPVIEWFVWILNFFLAWFLSRFLVAGAILVAKAIGA